MLIEPSSKKYKIALDRRARLCHSSTARKNEQRGDCALNPILDCVRAISAATP